MLQTQHICLSGSAIQRRATAILSGAQAATGNLSKSIILLYIVDMWCFFCSIGTGIRKTSYSSQCMVDTPNSLCSKILDISSCTAAPAPAINIGYYFLGAFLVVVGFVCVRYLFRCHSRRKDYSTITTSEYDDFMKAKGRETYG
jgi:hypothetical protein